VIFVGSQIPAGSDIEFPACRECNDRSKQYDQIAAMLALATPREATGEERSHFLKAVRGVRNNARAAIAEMNRGFAGWRHLAREFTNQTGLKAHAAELGPINRKAMFVLAAKLGLASYYRETGKIVPQGGAVIVDIVTNSRLLRDEVPEEYKLSLQFQTLSRHDIREQFLFRHALMDDAAGGMFQFALHLNFMLVAMVVEDRSCHPIMVDDKHTFIPGFLKTLPSPGPSFSTSLAVSVNDNPPAPPSAASACDA
jgi:hypothetical protein